MNEKHHKLEKAIKQKGLITRKEIEVMAIIEEETTIIKEEVQVTIIKEENT